jgi:ABC-type polysaccharide transport system permease subunit
MKYNSLGRKTGLCRRILNARYLFLLLFVPVIYVFIFNYVPIYGVLMVFQRFSPRMGVFRSERVGLYQFRRLFSSPNFGLILKNTLTLSIYGLIAGFPFPLILAICVNHCILRRFRKAVQSITFAPYFMSAEAAFFSTNLSCTRAPHGTPSFSLQAGLAEPACPADKPRSFAFTLRRLRQFRGSRGLRA